MNLISITAAAEILGVGRATAYRLAREGRIPTVRLSNRLFRVNEEKLRGMIEAESEASLIKPSPAGGKRPSTYPLSQSREQLKREFDELLKMRLTR